VSGTSVQLRVVGKLPLRCWGLNDLESQMGGPPLEVVNLPLAVCGLIDLRSLIHKLHPETQHAIDQSGELCCHRLDRDRCFQPASQSAKLCPQIGFAFPQAVSGHAEGHAQPVVRWQSAFANYPITTDSVVRTKPQPGNEMVLGWLLAHVPSRFADHGHRGQDIDPVDSCQAGPCHAK
jgi:hypothetical protein